MTLSAPKSVSLMAMVGGDERIVAAHDKAVATTLGWIEANAIETRMRDPATEAIVRAGDQKMVAVTFRHDTSRNLDPQLHTHSVVANMVQGGDGKWRTMVDDGLFNGKMAIGAIYRAELAQGLKGLGYGIDKTHTDGRFEIEGVPREVIDAFSTRRAEIEAAMSERSLGESKDNPHLAARAALLTRAAKRDIDRGALERGWKRQAKALGFSAAKVRANARKAERGLIGPDLFAGPGYMAGDAAAWAVGHLSERQSVFGHADLLAATLAREPGAVTVEAAERAITALERDGSLHAARGLDHGNHWTTDAALARESETIALMRVGQGAEKTVMRRWVTEARLHRGRLNEGQKEAVKIILAGTDRVVGVQGYAGTGKTTMLKRLRALGESQGYRTIGLAPSASAAKTLAAESGIRSETLQRYLARHDGIAQGRGMAEGLRKLRAANAKTMLVVDESSLASSAQMRNLMRIATALRLPHVVLVGDEKQLGAVEAGKPFAQLKAAGMTTAVMDDIVRQRDADLKAAVKAGLTGDVKTAFAKLGRQYPASRVQRSRHGDRAALAEPARTRARRDRGDRSDAGAARRNQRHHQEGPGRRRRHRRSRPAGREAGAARSHPRADEPRLELQRRRHGDLHPPLQAARGGEGRRAHRHRHRPALGHGASGGREGQPEALGAGPHRRRQGRHRGLPERGDGTAPGRPSALHAQRSGLGAYERRDRDGRIGRARRRGLPPRRRQDRQTWRAGPPAPAYRPRLRVDRSRLPGPDGRPDPRHDAGGESGADPPARVLRRDQPRPRAGRTGHRRRPQARGSARTCDRGAARGARRDGQTGRLGDRVRARRGTGKGAR